MASPASEIASLLNDSTFGLLLAGPNDPTGNLFVSDLPKTPDAAVAVLDSVPFPPDANLTRDANWSRPGVQILVRGAREGYAAAWTLANHIARDLHQAVPWVSTGGDHYKGCFLASGPLFLAYDDLRRPLFSLNFNLQVAWS